MNTRIWTIAGCVCGVLSLMLLTGLAAAQMVSDVAAKDLIVIAVADLLLGTASIGLLTGGRTVAAIRETSTLYLEGVSDTVDRLAQALPKGESGNLRRIG